MPPGIDTLTSAPLTIEVGGKTLLFAPLSFNDIGELQAWINARLFEQMPDPIAIARRLVEGMPIEVQSELLREAYRDARDAREARPTAPIGTPEAKAILGTAEGIRQIFGLSLRKHHPEMDAAGMVELAGSLHPGNLDFLFDHIFAVEAPSGPKAEGAEPTGARSLTGASPTNGSAGSPTASTPIRSVA